MGEAFFDIFGGYFTDSTPSLSPEAAIALRQHLNETIDEFEKVRKQLAEIEVKFESQQRELTIAKSDRKLSFLSFIAFPRLTDPRRSQ